MKKTLLGLLPLLSLTLTLPQSSVAQTAVFTDNFQTGNDTLNGTSTSGGNASLGTSYTSWDIAATKAATTGPTLSSGSFALKLNAATTSGLLETQARFTSSPVSLVGGDYIDLQVVFTDQTALAGGTASYLYAGLYNSAGNAPVAGSLNNSGLNSTAGSAFATGNAANWQGYVARVSNGGSSGTWVRPLQNGAGTTSGNQDLVGNNVSNGSTYNNPTGAQIGSSSTQSPSLTAASQYTLDFKLSYDGAGNLTLADALYSGVGTGGTSLFSYTSTATGSTLVATSFDGLAIGLRNSGVSFNPEIDINNVNITYGMVPEPATITIASLGAAALLVFRRRRV
jgi:hypothetical protein